MNSSPIPATSEPACGVLSPPEITRSVRRTAERRLPELDGLRALAILPVILLHCRPTEGRWHWLSAIGERGGIGVSLFFVLSGYLITGILLDSVGRPHYYRNFIARRAIRIFPLYYATLALFVLCPGLFATPSALVSMRDWGIGWFFAYMGNFRQAWLAQWPPVVSFSPLWSLQVEEQFYLLFPWLVCVLSRRNLARLLMACVAVAPMLRWILVLIQPRNWMAAAVLTPCRMDALALGGLVALAIRTEVFALDARRLRIISASLAIVAASASLLFKEHGAVWETPFSSSMAQFCVNVSFAASVAWTISAPSSRLVAILRWRPLTYTGQISYGLYLLHIPASWVARDAIRWFLGVEVPAHSLMAVPVTYCAAFAAAAISWKLFEKPILNLKSRFPSGV